MHPVPAEVPEHWDLHFPSQKKAEFLARLPSPLTAQLSRLFLVEPQPACSELTIPVPNKDSEAWTQSVESPG